MRISKNGKAVTGVYAFDIDACDSKLTRFNIVSTKPQDLTMLLVSLSRRGGSWYGPNTVTRLLLDWSSLHGPKVLDNRGDALLRLV